MSDAGQASGDGPARDVPQDLFADMPDWDAPLPDLADGATASGEAERRSAGGALPQQEHDGGGDAGGALTGSAADSYDAGAAAPAAGPALPDLGGDADDLWDPAAGLPVDGGHADAALTDLTGRPRRRGRATAGRDPDSAASARPAGSSGASGEPRGLATGGPIGGLEPGTLFGPDDGSGADAPRSGKRRRGRRGRGEAAPADGHAAAEPERPLTAEERVQHALKLAYRHLTKRDRTVSEVRAHLEKREVDEASISSALAELVEFGYLDDERYAARFVEDKRRLEGWGHLRIAQGLRRTGIDREIADRAVADDPLKEDEATLAVETLEQRLAGRAPDDDRARQKALRMLATKGYPLETAYAAVRTFERRCAERAAGD